MQNNRQLGRLGEDLAAHFLIAKGYNIVFSNLHYRFGEIDLIAVNHQKLLFIEVKMRTDDRFGTGEESFTKRKSHNFQLAILNFFREKKFFRYFMWQADLICVQLSKQGIKSLNIKHYSNIFDG